MAPAQGSLACHAVVETWAALAVDAAAALVWFVVLWWRRSTIEGRGSFSGTVGFPWPRVAPKLTFPQAQIRPVSTTAAPDVAPQKGTGHLRQWRIRLFSAPAQHLRSRGQSFPFSDTAIKPMSLVRRTSLLRLRGQRRRQGYMHSLLLDYCTGDAFLCTAALVTVITKIATAARNAIPLVMYRGASSPLAASKFQSG